MTSAQRTQIFEIFGLPQNGSGYSVFLTATLFGPFAEPYDFTALVTALNAKLDALTSPQETRVIVHLERWDLVGGTNPLLMQKSSSGAEGIIVDFNRERQNIHNQIAAIIGFYAPYGGWIADVRRHQGLSLTR